MKRKIVMLSMAVLWSSSPVSHAKSLVGLWAFDGTVGSNVGTVSNLANPGTINLTSLKSGAGVYPVYGSSTPGLQLYDPLSNTYCPLSSSLAVSIYGQGVTTGVSTALDSVNGFTFQLSFDLASTASVGNVIASRYASVSGTSTGWRILSIPGGRIDVQFFSKGVTTTLYAGSASSNYFDNSWHMLALTFDPSTNMARLGIDGTFNSVKLSTGSVAGDIDSNGLALTLGSSIGNGNGTSYFSAMSYADSVLTNAELMTVVPEPATIGFVLMGLAVLLIPGWQRRRAIIHPVH